MTTIVADVRRGIVAADSLITTYSSLTAYRTAKLFRHNGSIYGGAGDVAAGYKFQRWVLDGMPKRERPKFHDLAEDDFTVLELCKDGLFMWDTSIVREPVSEDVYAVGSGSKIALYCIKVREMSAEDAILEAAKVDLHTAGPVQTLVLEGK